MKTAPGLFHSKNTLKPFKCTLPKWIYQKVKNASNISLRSADNVLVQLVQKPFLHVSHSGWLDFLRFNALFNCISVISGQWEGDNEILCAVEPRLRLKIFWPSKRIAALPCRSQ